MKKLNIITLLTILGLSSSMFLGCSSDSDSPLTTYAASGVIVDPYIVGAVMCEDLNTNGSCDTGEQLSTASDASGLYKFTNSLTTGSDIIVKTHGKHEGKTYDLNISSVVSSSDSAGITSPMTTLNARGLTATQVASILNSAASAASLSGSFSITSTDILADPLSDGLLNKKVSEITDADLAKIQASLATYALLKIMNGSSTLSALTGAELYASGMGTDVTGAVKTIITATLTQINLALNTTTLTSIKTAIGAAKIAVSTGIVTAGSGLITQATADAKVDAGMPEPTVGLITKVAVTIIDKLASVGYEKCNTTSGDYASALVDVTSYATTNITPAKVLALGSQLYGLTYHDEMKSTFSGIYSAALSGIFSADSNIQAGYNANEAGNTTFRFDASGSTVAQ